MAESPKTIDSMVESVRQLHRLVQFAIDPDGNGESIALYDLHIVQKGDDWEAKYIAKADGNYHLVIGVDPVAGRVGRGSDPWEAVHELKQIALERVRIIHDRAVQSLQLAKSAAEILRNTEVDP